MSTLFTELFQGNVPLDTEKRIELVSGLKEFLVFDNLFTKEEIVPADFASVLSKYGWCWVSCGTEHLVVNDITAATDEKNAQLSYYDTRKGIVSQINFTDFVAKVRTSNPAEELEYAVVRLLRSSGEGASPVSPIKNPFETYIGDAVNNENRIELWRKNWKKLAEDEFNFWALDASNPELNRNTEISIFKDLDPADPFVIRFSELIAVADLQQKREMAFDYLNITVKKRYTYLISATSDKLIKKQYADELKIKKKEAQELLKLANTALLGRLNANTWYLKTSGGLQVNSRFKTEVADFFVELEKSPSMLVSNLRYAKRILAYATIIGKSTFDAWVYICNADAWSAAFITYVVKNGMLETEKTFKSDSKTSYEAESLEHFGFFFSARHADYWAQALVNRLNRDYSKPFWLFHLYEKPVQVGDIIVKTREYEKIELNLSMKPYFSFSKSAGWKITKKGKASHSDIIYKIAEEPDPLIPSKMNRYAYTIGGNTRDLTNEVNTVGRKKYLLAPAPIPVPIADINKDNPAQDSVLYEVDANNGGPTENSSAWSIIKIIDAEIETEWNLMSLKETDTFKELFGVAAPDAAARKMKIIPPVPALVPIVPVP